MKIGATTFNPNFDACYVAVFVNGEKVWPADDKDPTNKSGWTLFAKEATAESLNKLWADVVLNIRAGDEIVFAVARYNSNPQTILYPSVEYID